MDPTDSTAHPHVEPDDAPVDMVQTGCCIVGGGPAGVVMALLLARQGIDVTLLEAHKDFDRDFRGDTIHPSTLELLDQIGLADRLLELPHGKLDKMRIVTPAGARTMVDLSRLKTRFPYVMLLPQVAFLNFLTDAARQYSSFHLTFGANVQRLVREGDLVRGVRYRGADDRWHEVRAPLTVACDGRFSKLRSLAGLEPIKTAQSIDVVWCRFSRRADDPGDEGSLNIRGGHMLVLLNRGDQWQGGFLVLKGGFAELKSQGIEALQRGIVSLVPWLADRVTELADWKHVSVLSVESSRLPQWFVPGMLLIGDAAHVMSPVGGVGINYAIQDAVEAVNLLSGALGRGSVSLDELAAVQRRRERPTRAIQALQRLIQRTIVANAMDDSRPFQLPLAARLVSGLPWLRDVPARLVAFGLHRVRLET